MDYLQATINANQTGIASGYHVEYSQVASDGAGLALSTGAGQADGVITLPAGVWLVEWQARQYYSTVADGEQQLVEHDTSTVVVDDSGASLSSGGHSNHSAGTAAAVQGLAVVTLAAPTDLCVNHTIFGGAGNGHYATGVWVLATSLANSQYILATLSAAQSSNLSAGNHVEFDQSAANGSGIGLSSGSGQALGIISLPAGTWDIAFQARGEASGGNTPHRSTYRLYDAGLDSALDDDLGTEVAAYATSYDTGTTETPACVARGIVTLASATTLKVEKETDHQGTVESHNERGTWFFARRLQ
jgi:hypothetical protein